jgi:hypothetical protein
MKRRKHNRRMFISADAKKESKCFISEGYGRTNDIVTDCGRFFTKPAKEGSSFLTGTGEPPLRFKKLCCLFTTACGRSILELT